ncbi:MAG: hypothetical protein H6Q15_1642 [Bacteroidetes bacterium]|nr:hypothetical protein [Bacteroidota bacterium]
MSKMIKKSDKKIPRSDKKLINGREVAAELGISESKFYKMKITDEFKDMGMNKSYYTWDDFMVIMLYVSKPKKKK